MIIIKTDYSINKMKNKIEVTACVNQYNFYPEGKQEDWIKYASEVFNTYKLPTFLYAERQDKETGYITNEYIYTIN